MFHNDPRSAQRHEECRSAPGKRWTAMPDLDQIIVKVAAGLGQFKAQMASADASLDAFGASAKAAGAAGAGVGTTVGAGATQFERYAAALKSSYGLNDSLTKSQVGVIRNLEAQVAATK